MEAFHPVTIDARIWSASQGESPVFVRAMHLPLKRQLLIGALLSACAWLGVSPSRAASVLIEAESFADLGGWMTDTQFTLLPEIGSPYLMAHGLGRPVAPARTTIGVPQAGEWRVLVRTKDWVAPWQAPGAPGRFRVVLNGAALPVEFGASGTQWHWQDGGQMTLPAGKVNLELHDLTGFNGRCDAILLTTDPNLAPPNRDPELRAFRRPLHLRLARGVGHRARDAQLRHDGRGCRQGRVRRREKREQPTSRVPAVLE
jgi:hypothetical protein